MSAFDQIACAVALGWYPAGFVLLLIYNLISPCKARFLDSGDLFFKVSVWPMTLLAGAAITYSHLRRSRRVQD